MAVAYDASSRSAATFNTSVASFNWTHTPVGTPAGVLLIVVIQANSDYFTSATYGSVNLIKDATNFGSDTTTEAGRCYYAFYGGTGIPTGAQTVTVNRTNNANGMWAAAFTVTSSSSYQTEVYTPGMVILNNNQALAEQSVTDGSPGSNSVRFAGTWSGLATAPAAGASSTQRQTGTFSTTASASTVSENAAGQGARNVGFSASTDDVAAIHLAVREIFPPPDYFVVTAQGQGAGW